MKDMVKTRTQPTIPPTSPKYFRGMVLQAIRDLEAVYAAGEIEYDSYHHRLRALERMLR